MKEKLLEQLKEAMRNKDTLAKDTITLLRAAILQYEKDKQVVLNENQMIDIVYKEIDKRKESLSFYTLGSEEYIKILNETAILESFLPENQLKLNEIVELVEDVGKGFATVSMREMGKILLKISSIIEGRANKKFVNSVIKTYIENRIKNN